MALGGFSSSGSGSIWVRSVTAAKSTRLQAKDVPDYSLQLQHNKKLQLLLCFIIVHRVIFK